MAYRRKMDAHRHIAEMALGRELLRSELVHHWDEDPENEDPGNLLVVTSAEHARYHLQIHPTKAEGGRIRNRRWYAKNQERARALSRERVRRYRAAGGR